MRVAGWIRGEHHVFSQCTAIEVLERARRVQAGHGQTLLGFLSHLAAARQSSERAPHAPPVGGLNELAATAPAPHIASGGVALPDVYIERPPRADRLAHFAAGSGER